MASFISKVNADDLDRFWSQGNAQERQALRQVGREAVTYAVENGDYHNVTGRLRASNRYRVCADGLELYNDTPYAAEVESRGYEVIGGAALVAEQRLKEVFG